MTTRGGWKHKGYHSLRPADVYMPAEKKCAMCRDSGYLVFPSKKTFEEAEMCRNCVKWSKWTRRVLELCRPTACSRRYRS